MSKGASYGLIAVIAIALVGAGVYAYVISPTKAPSAMVDDRTGGAAMTGGVMTGGNAMNASGTTAMPAMNDGKYHIVAEQSKASFSLEEDLRGTHITVTGVTSQVSGAVKADRTNLTAIQLDPIRINARTFVTDNESRNNAIRRMILKTEDDANEFIEFIPKSVTDVPATADVGQAFPFKVVGDLKVSGTTKEVTFTGTAKFVSDTQLSGTAETKVHYPDFGVTVPNLPFLANVDQDTTLKIEFVAQK